MTDNEKLIEEAAKAIAFLRGDLRDGEQDRVSASVALAVFEKAHTPTEVPTQAASVLEVDGDASSRVAPTDDEREALVRAWDEGHRRGIRWKRGNAPENPYRTEAPEPNPEPRHFAPYGSTNALCDETVPRRVAWDETTGEYADQRFTVKRDRTSCPECRWRMGLGPGPQGEPSDAQVEAGCVAFYEHATGLTSWARLVEYDSVLADRYRDGIRRALRAAGGVR